MAFVGILSQIKFLFEPLASYSACVVYTKTIIHHSVVESGGYYLGSTSVNIIVLNLY